MPCLLSALATFSLLLCPAFASPWRDPIAHTDGGLVIGETYSIPDAPDSVNKFLGIPFAISPPETKRSSKPIIAKEKKPSCIQQFTCMLNHS